MAGNEEGQTQSERLLGLFVDLLFTLDMVLNFFCEYELPDGSFEQRFSKIAKTYISGWFLIDLVSCIPVEFFELIISLSTGTIPTNSRYSKLARLPRMYRIFKILRILKVVKAYKYN
jgi:hypothetical protein